MDTVIQLIFSAICNSKHASYLAAGPWTWGQCVAWCACLLPCLRRYKVLLLVDGVNVCVQLAQGRI